MAPKKTATPTKPETSMVKWEEEMARQAEFAAAATAAASGTFISAKNGVLSVDKTPVPGNSMEAVVLGHCFENAYYTGKYDPNNPQPPVCFAFGVVRPGMSVEDIKKLQDTMKPHEASVEPQSPTCKECKWNQWASADEGRGKACKNLRRIAVIAGDENSLEDIAGQKVYYLKPPVTSSRNWDGYVKDVAKTLKRPPLGVVTNIAVVPDQKYQFLINFTVSEKISDPEHFEALTERARTVAEEIDFPYQPATDEPQQQAPARGAANRKFAAAAPAKSPAPRGGRR